MGFSFPYFLKGIFILQVCPWCPASAIQTWTQLDGWRARFGTELDAVPKIPKVMAQWQEQENPPNGKPASLLLWLSVDGWWGNVTDDGNLGGWRENSDFMPKRGLGVNLELQPLAVLGLETSPLLVIIFPLLNDLVLPATQIRLGWAAIS